MTSLGFTEPDVSELWIHSDGTIVQVEAVTATSVLFRDVERSVWIPLTSFLTDFRYYAGAEEPE